MNRQTIALSMMIAAFAGLLLTTAAEAQTNLAFYPLTPCRLVDTRNANGVNGGPKMLPNASRDFSVRGNCGVPLTAKAVALNISVTQATVGSWLTLWPSGGTRPVVSAINFEPTDPALGNGAIVGVSTNAQDLSVYNNQGQVHLILDITGYFE